MALTPWTRQEEWYQQMINASTGNYLPSITAQDEGKVLTVENDGSWGVENVPSELPAVTASDKDKFLHTNDSTGAVEWADAPTELPSVSGSDEGKVLTVNNSGVWGAQEPIGKKFIVTLTPTALDYSGTMDKTVSDIDAAYRAGREIVARVIVGDNSHIDIALNSIETDDDMDYSGFAFYVVRAGSIVEAYTDTTNDGTETTYSTNVYALTPAT